jgi:hypothetical protein
MRMIEKAGYNIELFAKKLDQATIRPSGTGQRDHSYRRGGLPPRG